MVPRGDDDAPGDRFGTADSGSSPTSRSPPALRCAAAWLGFQFPRHAPDNATLSYDNQTAFDLINTAKITTPQAARAAMYAQAEMILLNDYRDIPIAHAKGVLLVRKNVEGVVGQPDGNEYLELVSVR